MIVDFFRRGTGASNGSIDYLLGKNRDREHAIVLQGDIQEVAGLIDTSPYAKRYTAGCLSFYEHDMSDKDKQKIMDDFEQCLFPGLDKSSYRILWVQHQDKINEETKQTRLELNFLIPNVEINTGKRLQPFYAAADLDRVECFKQITNYGYGLHDPDDPANRQATKVAKALPTNAKELKATLEIEATLAIAEGMVFDRQSLVKWLEGIGMEVTRQTPKSISIKHPDDAKARPIRLTGAMYEQDFRYTDESPSITSAASASYRAAATERYRASCERYDKMLAAKSEYHQQRYRPQQQRDPESSHRQHDSTIAADRAEHGKDQDAAATRHDSPIARTTTADQTATSELAAVERLEPRNSPSGKGKENPYHVEYSLDFNSVYRSYLLYLSDIRYQKQEQRDAGKNSTITADRSSYTTENSGIQYSGGSTVQGERGQVDDFGSAAIADYRAAARTAQRATEAARASLAIYPSAESHNRRARELQQAASTVLRSIERERHRADANHQPPEESRTVREFIAASREHVAAAARGAFDAVNREVEHRAADHQSLTRPSTERDREAVRATNQAGDRENEFSRAISAKTSRFSATPIREALERVEQRQQIEVEKKQDYDSPRPF
ncbi:hypothetical protein [Acinetobacter baumannii]